MAGLVCTGNRLSCAPGPMAGTKRSGTPMLGFAWLALRQAQGALRKGRLEEAQRLLDAPSARRHRGRELLLRTLALAHVERAEAALQRNDPEAAWQDVLRAEQLPGGVAAGERLRAVLGQRGTAQVRALLDLAEPTQSPEAVARLRDRAVALPELAALSGTARDWLQARDDAQQGEIDQAQECVQRLRGLQPLPILPLDEFARDLQKQQTTLAPLLKQLRQAAEEECWRDVVSIAEKVLQVAPRHAGARQLRSQAWNQLQPTTVVANEPTVAIRHPGQVEGGQRLLLWIDGVGGFLVCLGDRVTLGQAATDSWVDVPLFADVSRLHALVTRDASSYILEGLRPVQVNTQQTEKAILRSGDRVTLGTSCQIQFHQPVPVSSTARLDVMSGHRLPWAVDAVLLMADTLVIGPGTQVHISMPDLTQPLVLFRQKESLGVRHAGEMRVDGRGLQGTGAAGPGSSGDGGGVRIRD